MTEVTLELRLRTLKDAECFELAVDEFARKRLAKQQSTYEHCEAEQCEAPTIMVRTKGTNGSTVKTVIFQKSDTAAEFMRMWRFQQKRSIAC